MTENKLCPSYDCGFCTTSPTQQSMKCEELTDCKWHNIEQFKKEQILWQKPKK